MQVRGLCPAGGASGVVNRGLPSTATDMVRQGGFRLDVRRR
jgi:hypothetical protein